MYFTKHDIEARRDKVASKWNAILNDEEAVVVFSGEPIQKPGGLDQHYPFLAHPAYYWLTGRRRDGEVLLYNRNSGWIEFQNAFTKEQAVWENEKNDLLVSQPGRDIRDFRTYLEAQKFATVYELGQSGKPVTGKAFELRTLSDQVRRVKDAAEIKLVKEIAAIAAHGYNAIEKLMQPGISENEIRLVFETEIMRHGADAVPYDTIVGSGINSAVLHALPTRKLIQPNEFILVDAGAEVAEYCVDITRTFGSSEQMSAMHKAIYSLVLKVQEECMAMSRPGVFWRDVHAHAAIQFTKGLHELGILKGNVSQLIEKEVIALFFPHGVGHLVGLRVRDTGQEENMAPKTYFGSRLRVDIQLEAGHLITVEPGLYFIDLLLSDPANKARFNDDINWDELEKWKHIGGVRIEDNIVITENGNDNLTACVTKNKQV